jgi:hypothetical protein
LDKIPAGLIFAGTIVIMMLAFEAGFRLAYSRRRLEKEKETAVSSIMAAILGLTAFMLALTFQMVTDRFEMRKDLVREEANTIGTAYLRTDFLAEPDRARSAALLREYVVLRLEAVQSRNPDLLRKSLIESARIQRQLWAMAVVNARKDLNSDIGSLYIEVLNRIFDIHALRVSIGWQMRMPTAIWLVLCVLVLFSMIGLGFQTAIAGSRESWAAPILALSFSVVIMLVVSLDRPQSRFIMVSQQPLENLLASMNEPSQGSSSSVEQKPDSTHANPIR